MGGAAAVARGDVAITFDGPGEASSSRTCPSARPGDRAPRAAFETRIAAVVADGLGARSAGSSGGRSPAGCAPPMAPGLRNERVFDWLDETLGTA